MFGKTIALGAAALIVGPLSSCYYDPAYYSGSATTASYSSGYGSGYAYGSPSFSTSLFISTGNPRWGYDPHCYAYYDYSRRCYYDPYGHGYYPIGYRPPVVVGVPHPYGWRPGRGYCPPPQYVRDVRWSGYHDRASSYRNGGYSWSKGVRVQPVPSRPNPATRGVRPSNGYPAATPYRNQGVRPANQAPSRGGNNARPSNSNKKRYITSQEGPTQFQARQQAATSQTRQSAQARTRAGSRPQPQAQPNGRNKANQGRPPAQNQRQYREEERKDQKNQAPVRGLGRA
jgi:hypothetical protein